MTKNILFSPRANMRRCAFALGAIVAVGALANTVVADDPKIFDKKVSGVPSANPEIIVDNTLSAEFRPGLIAEGLDLLENPSGPITRFGYLSDNSRTEPDENTYL